MNIKKNFPCKVLFIIVLFSFFIPLVSGFDKNDPAKPCLDCHRQKVMNAVPVSLKERYIHQPARLNRCSVCHREDDKDAIDEATLCFNCHNVEKFKGKLFRHPPLREKNYCLSCHQPHSSDHQFLLKDDPVAFCQSCHIKMKVCRSHPVGRMIQDPFHDREMTCTSSCHDVHLSNFATLIPCEKRELCIKCHSDIVR